MNERAPLSHRSPCCHAHCGLGLPLQVGPEYALQAVSASFIPAKQPHFKAYPVGQSAASASDSLVWNPR